MPTTISATWWAYDSTLSPHCFSPSATWQTTERNTHQQHELRLSTPDDWRVRASPVRIWENNTLYDTTSWRYKGCRVAARRPSRETGCISDVGPFPGLGAVNPGAQPDNTSFYQDTLRETKQLAFFASADYDLIPKALTLTRGTRHFLFENEYKGSVLSSFGCFEGGVQPGGCHDRESTASTSTRRTSDTEYAA